jgi:hypothetical protein
MTDQKTLENYWYAKGGLDFRDKLLSNLQDAPTSPEVEWAYAFIFGQYPSSEMMGTTSHQPEMTEMDKV